MLHGLSSRRQAHHQSSREDFLPARRAARTAPLCTKKASDALITCFENLSVSPHCLLCEPNPRNHQWKYFNTG